MPSPKKPLYIKLRENDAIHAQNLSYIVKSEYSDGLVGILKVKRKALYKIRQILKQMLVINIQGAELVAEIDGIEYAGEFSSTLVPSAEYTSDKEYEHSVGWISTAVSTDSVVITLHAPTGNASVSWNITQNIKADLDEVLSNYRTEKSKRSKWVSDYRANGKKPVCDLPGAPRGRKPKYTNN